ncbi:hypothetical protein RB2501_00196 [Robiginitalea biformata HTCC2501]|uniref:Uncharacterized protein n=1 Tax=Robiginitalea biformata (strain ATCC BAA-864 / DSM 15991 / KCTC 12146 / HTCC2501) TaxID=313596 RepID=A4CNI2_ROBBH|nr:hypothetical protein RB2501_00196 [Robiginitalea biformata HTCC2501]
MVVVVNLTLLYIRKTKVDEFCYKKFFIQGGVSIFNAVNR